ncbi:protein of unknown function UPF0001 [[Leptolyngbya] sp. PCC 7376]|uniref:YggS family pyridoxal phosphate-dependent enzyme n=1 Tax=[Leptolyngbya] sp. PCC 7376 TaxID=111781 RepID=UPI00029F4B2A|nr:YggS family pyridoxal phosphate-dependent enzyme [[Leptolyngbya] sp. PCC 7376]AFY40088.1 protein of unknown function UPF0001 [[Leptolyngbya] sp. PCC 7376]
MDTTGSIAERIEKVCAVLPASVKLIAVSKQASAEAIRAAYAAGLRDFAESKVQEEAKKQEELKDLTDITWHLIGHLQSNKAAKAIQQFQWIQSVDTLKLARRLNQLAGELSRTPSVCLQVKVLPDPDKFGLSIQELMTALAELNELQNLKIRGLMTILPLGLTDTQILEGFKSLKQLSLDINNQNLSRIQIEELSMGMSGDYALAIEAGSTMVRVGRSIFGERKVMSKSV